MESADSLAQLRLQGRVADRRECFLDGTEIIERGFGRERNLHSQAAIKKLGAQYEGTLRSQRLMPDGYRRDSVYFSILDHDWPAAKLRLEERLRAFGRSGR